MKIVVISNWSDNIANLNALTAPVKEKYCERHSYDFINRKAEFSDVNHIEWLRYIVQLHESYDVVMTVGCDVLFMNHQVKIEHRMDDDARVIVAKEEISWWPINNDVMIWPRGSHSENLLRILIENASTWLTYPWLWQAYLWDLIQCDKFVRAGIRLVEAREMNSCWQPGPGKWKLGDWILHAVDARTPQKRIEIISTYLPFVGDGTYIGLPKSITGRK